eukprot:TRINITY_DN433_c0_g1_i1.p1 TRINITY_DN433_c0_g1~~TRINITY_DN433_c0_g1_i1.p1  ORF type:complete len:185 (-),score=66.41 TRINITY_DN433_c0_g1_i1:146-700(-)
MLKIAQKRTRDWTSEMDVCNSNNRVFTPQLLTKRLRNDSMETEHSAEGNSSLSSSPPNSSFHYARSHTIDSPFIPSENESNTKTSPEDLKSYLPAHTRRNLHKVSSSAVTQPSSSTSPSNEVLFTEQQVKEIVNRIVGEKMEQLRCEYDRILQEKLQEQYRNFAKYNEDYLSRQYKDSDFSYLN